MLIHVHHTSAKMCPGEIRVHAQTHAHTRIYQHTRTHPQAHAHTCTDTGGKHIEADTESIT